MNALGTSGAQSKACDDDLCNWGGIYGRKWYQTV